MRQHITHLFGLRQQIDRINTPTTVHCPQQQAQGLQAIGHDHRHRLTRLRAQGAQPSGRLAAIARKFGIGEPRLTLRVTSINSLRALTGLRLYQRTYRGAHDCPYLAK